MKTAREIMKTKAFIKAEMDKQLSKEQSDALWERATEKLTSILEQYRSLPEGVHGHTDNFIFPSAAVYLCAKESCGTETAYKIIEDSAIQHSGEAGRKLAKLLKIPGLQGLFIRIWDPLTKKKFGSDSGFQNVFYPKKKGEYRMDVTACPYCKYLTELGCPEITKIFCANDNRVYGNLPGIKFERTGTLGTGADKCDFCLRMV